LEWNVGRIKVKLPFLISLNNKELEGIVFDIQRFGLHDGPGVRTVVFLKGCPLSCKWCSNPESIELQPQLSFAKEKCTEAENCISSCPEGVFSNRFWKAKVDFDDCTACGKCVEVCPSDALKLYGYSTSTEQLLEIINRDKDYYRNTGGGLTLSGGEPLMQFDFALDLLRKAKLENIHTCIETAGFVTKDRIEQVLPFTDLFLYDYKLTDDSQHQYYTGVSNQIILENLELLLKNGAQVVLRCIIIPGVNDNSEHFKAIAGLSEHENIKQVDIMPYHEYGKHKYEQLGMKAYEFGVKTTDKELAHMWVDEIKNYGCKKVKLG
ncbi:MAG: glycyl-radical enzyme activating protein, partial [Draconibacterium sp.]|nr:glycyl-radical enzyme activating protein [Draconibacterium sp.]